MVRLSTRVAIGLLAGVLSSTPAVAQDAKPAPLVISPQVIERGIASAQQAIPLAPRPFGVPQQRAGSASTGRRVMWTAIGSAGGFFGGAYLGAWIENTVHPCGCDDPGLTGVLIGAPIGAVVGAVTGFLLSK